MISGKKTLQRPQAEPAASTRIDNTTVAQRRQWLAVQRFILALAACMTFAMQALAQPQPKPAAAQRFDLPALMALLAQTKAASATFVEERHVQGFAAPLVASGELSFKAPDVFERRTDKPMQEALRVEGQQLVMTRGSLRRTTTLDSAPEAGALVGAFRGTLMGDAAALAQHFDAALQGTASQWQLDLNPKESSLRAVVRSVSMRGARGIVSSVEVMLANGDRSIMFITPK
jgi:outer membrane lipoprotein-sorting protein